MIRESNPDFRIDPDRVSGVCSDHIVPYSVRYGKTRMVGLPVILKKVPEYFNRFDTLPYMVKKDTYYTKVETDKRTDTAQWQRPR